MKARFLSLLAVVLCLVSCQRDADDLNVAMGGEQDVMLTVSLPEATRATDSALGFNLQTLGTTYDLRYILEIYRVDANDVVLYDKCQRFVETSDDSTMVFPVRLAPGYKYRIVAWADIVDEGSKADRYYYTEEGLDNVVIKDNGTVNWNAMDETRDAYTGLQTITFNKTSDLKDMELTRPFAKVRVVATDITDIREVGLEPTTATVTYSQNMYFKYNAVADVENKGVAEGAKAKSHTYTYAQTITEYDDATGEFTLFTDYIFVPELGTAKFELSVKDQNGGEIKYNHFNTEIFVERNKLTTIKGDVLTTGGNVSVKVENGFGEFETITIVDTAEDLQDKINNAATNGEETNITLGGNIDLGAIAGILSTRASEAAGLVIPAGKSIVLDLNGYTISQSKECTDSYSMILNNGELTITGEGTIEFTNTAEGGSSTWGTYTIENRGEGVLTIDNATIRHNGCVNGEVNRDTNIAIQNYQGKVVINDGTIASTQFRSLRDFTAGGEIIINGGTFLGQVWMQGLGSGSSSLTINGGDFTPIAGYDGSSVYISNSSNIVNVAVNGGMFNTKIGCYDATKEGANGCIVGGEFTSAAKENTNAALINDDLEWTEAENGNWTLTRKPDVAKIGEVGYTSLQKAIDAVKEGETIVVENNITITEGINNNGVSYTRGASFTLDLNDHTVTSNLGNNALRFKIGDGNDVTNTNVTIEIKNGTVISGDSNWCAISAATASNSENKLTINLNKVTVYNSKAGDYGVKAWEGATINAKDVTINATKCAGGFYAAGGEIVLDNCTVNQKGLHTAPYMSMAIGVSGKGKLTVNSGNYSTEPTAAAEGYNQGTSHGSWCAGVMSSGGELTINGGTFANGNFGDDALATAARECVMVDAYGTLTINGGTFNALKKIIYIINDTSDGAIANPVAYVNGGDFSADPTDNGGYTDPILPEGYSAIQLQNGRWTIGSVVAKVGETTYYNIDEAIAAWTNNTTLTLLNDVTLNDVVKIKSTEARTLDLGTYTLTAASGKNAIEVTCEGRSSASYALTVNADATNPGGITAKGKACIYYSKSGSTKDRPIIRIYNGVFNGSYSINSKSNGNTNCPQFWIYGGTFNNNVNLTKNMLRVFGGTFHGWINCTGDTSAYREISGGRFKSWQFMTADALGKFWVGTAKDTYDKGCYVDDEGYLVVGGPVITEETRAEYEATYGVKFANKTTYSKWSSYLKYSSAAEHGLYYTNENWLKTKETDAVSDSTVEE